MSWRLGTELSGFCDRASWTQVKERDQQDATNLKFIQLSISTCFGHHYAHLQENKNKLGCKLCALYTVHTACIPAPQDHGQHNQCRTPYAVKHSFVLLNMGIMLPETCWDSWNKLQISCILLVSLFTLWMEHLYSLTFTWILCLSGWRDVTNTVRKRLAICMSHTWYGTPVMNSGSYSEIWQRNVAAEGGF